MLGDMWTVVINLVQSPLIWAPVLTATLITVAVLVVILNDLLRNPYTVENMMKTSLVIAEILLVHPDDATDVQVARREERALQTLRTNPSMIASVTRVDR